MTLDEAVKFFGGKSEMSRRLGISPSAVSMWIQRGNAVPLAVQWQIELGTKGKLKAEEPPLLPKTRK